MSTYFIPFDSSFNALHFIFWVEIYKVTAWAGDFGTDAVPRDFSGRPHQPIELRSKRMLLDHSNSLNGWNILITVDGGFLVIGESRDLDGGSSHARRPQRLCSPAHGGEGAANVTHRRLKIFILFDFQFLIALILSVKVNRLLNSITSV